MKALSWRAVSGHFEEFQATISRKSLVSVLEQRGLVPWLGVVLLVRRGYMGFQEAGYNCGLLHSCGKMSTIEPQIYFFTF